MSKENEAVKLENKDNEMQTYDFSLLIIKKNIGKIVIGKTSIYKDIFLYFLGIGTVVNFHIHIT